MMFGRAINLKLFEELGEAYVCCLAGITLGREVGD